MNKKFFVLPFLALSFVSCNQNSLVSTIELPFDYKDIKDGIYISHYISDETTWGQNLSTITKEDIAYFYDTITNIKASKLEKPAEEYIYPSTNLYKECLDYYYVDFVFDVNYHSYYAYSLTFYIIDENNGIAVFDNLQSKICYEYSPKDVRDAYQNISDYLSTRKVNPRFEVEADLSSDGVLELEEAVVSSIYLRIKDDIFNVDLADKISIEYDKTCVEIEYVIYIYKAYKFIYSITPLKPFEKTTISFSLNNEIASLIVSSKAFDFNAHSISKISEERMEKLYPTFNSILDSIKFHQYESPFIGKDPNGQYSFTRDDRIDYYPHYENELYKDEYIKYIPSSFYYISGNDIDDKYEDVYVRFLFADSSLLDEGASESTFDYFKIVLNSDDILYSFEAVKHNANLKGLALLILI